MTEAGLTEEEIDTKMQDCFECMTNYYKRNVHKDTINLLDGVQNLLKECEKQNILMALVTGNVKEIAYEKLKRLGISNYFSCGGFGSEHHKRAELVKIAIKHARKMEFNGEIFLVGDTPRDIEAAKNSQEKIITIAVATGEFTKEELKNAGADYALNDLTKTTEIIRLFLLHHQRAFNQ